MISRYVKLFLPVLTLLVTACEKNIPGSAAKRTLYSESVYYLKPGNADHIVYPINQKQGTYTSFPLGLDLDEKTGAINVNRSETGLRYLVFFDGDDGAADSTSIIISGINYSDHFYNLSKGDSIAYPVYNAGSIHSIPGSSFDVSNEAAAYGVMLVPANGSLNLAASVRNGMFGSVPANNTKKDIPISYRLNDESDRALNSIIVRFYYFSSAKDVPRYLHELLEERKAAFQPLLTGTRMFPKKIKPRPPCVIIIAH